MKHTTLKQIDDQVTELNFTEHGVYITTSFVNEDGTSLTRATEIYIPKEDYSSLVESIKLQQKEELI